MTEPLHLSGFRVLSSGHYAAATEVAVETFATGGAIEASEVAVETVATEEAIKANGVAVEAAVYGVAVATAETVESLRPEVLSMLLRFEYPSNVPHSLTEQPSRSGPAAQLLTRMRRTFNFMDVIIGRVPPLDWLLHDSAEDS